MIEIQFPDARFQGQPEQPAGLLCVLQQVAQSVHDIRIPAQHLLTAVVVIQPTQSAANLT